MPDRVVITGEYLDSTIEGTPLGLGGLKVNRDGVHLCSGYGRRHVSVSWDDVESIDIDAEDEDGDDESLDTATRGAPAQRQGRLFARRSPEPPSDVLVTVSCRGGNVVVLRSRPTGRKGSYRDLRDRLTPYVGLIRQSS